MTRSVANATEDYEQRLAGAVDRLAPAERRVAEALLDMGPSATLLSAAAIARRVGTSDATVVRTAKALGFSGLSELRHALVAAPPNPSPGERLRSTLDTVPRGEILAASLSAQLSALDALARHVSSDQFDEAVAVLTGSSRVVWRGIGPSAHLAEYGAILTERIGKASRALVHVGTRFADELLTLTDTDAVVLLAYGRVQAHVRVLLEHAHNLGAPVVVITDTLLSREPDVAQVVLQSGRGSPGLFASHGATVVLIEALVLGVAANDRATADASLATLNELRAELAGRRIDVDRP